MTQTLFPKMAILGSAFYLAASEIINEALDTANKVGTMGMQSLLAFMMFVLGVVIWYIEKKRSAERLERDKIVLDQYRNLMTHHEDFAKEVQIERSGFQLEMKAHAAELRGLTERSIVAMHAMATSTDALREWLKERSPLPSSRTQSTLREPQD